VRLNFEQANEIPRLAWFASVRRDRVEVVHGCDVETRPKFFTDGVWAGEFDAGQLDHSFLVGTGGVCREDHIVFCASNAPLDRLFMMEFGNAVVVSNSLPCILELTGDTLDPHFRYYRSLFMAMEGGARICRKTFPTANGQGFRMLLCETLRVDSDGRCIITPMALESDFRDFEHYRAKLAQTMRMLIENSMHEGRSVAYPPLITLSSGYDSCAVAVLGCEAGATEAVTMLRPRPDNPEQLDDHPGEVARVLGLDLIGVERNTWRSRTDRPEADLAATCATMMDVSLLALEAHLPQRLVLVGYPGDIVWGKENFRCYRDVVQGIGHLSGRSLAEYRLRVGFTVLPIGFVGLTAHPSIFSITNSPAVVPWSVGGSYDRPIPRRIVEEAGVHRGAFATRKFAGGARVGSTNSSYAAEDRGSRTELLVESMSAASAESFLDFCERNEHPPAWGYRPDRVGHWFLGKLDALNFRVGRRLHPYGIKALVPRRVMVALSGRFKIHLDFTYLLPHWGTSVLQREYEEACLRSRQRWEVQG
jgi:hypothetical protein